MIQSNHKVFSTENAYWERHAGYRKNKSSKIILHDSLLCLKETLSELYDGIFHISSIVKLNCSTDFGYFVYFPENDLMIKIYADAMEIKLFKFSYKIKKYPRDKEQIELREPKIIYERINIYG